MKHYHDPDLDCGAPTFDGKFFVKLAKLVKRHYGELENHSEVAEAMTIAERLHKLASKEDAAGGFVSVGGLVIDMEALAERRKNSPAQKQRDLEDDATWEIPE